MAGQAVIDAEFARAREEQCERSRQIEPSQFPIVLAGQMHFMHQGKRHAGVDADNQRRPAPG